jgi:hypothetical protein
MVCSSEGGRWSICPYLQWKRSYTYKFYFTFLYSFICICGHAPFQRPLVGWPLICNIPTNSKAGLGTRGASPRRRLCAPTSRNNGNFWSLKTWSPTLLTRLILPLTISSCVQEWYRSYEGIASRMFRKIRNNLRPSYKWLKKFSCSDGRNTGPLA